MNKKHQLTKEEKARIYDLYLPETILIYQGVRSEDLCFYGKKMSNARLIRENLANEGDWKMILRPLSAITDEDAMEVARIYPADIPEATGEDFLTRSNDCIFINTKNDSGGDDPLFISYATGECIDMNGITSNGILIHQFLIQRGYAIPLFIAPNHPLNGMTAIELGLAIDATASK